MTPLSEVFPVRFGGYWGLAPGEADIDALAIRNGDVGISGSIDWARLPTRAFTAREADKALVVAGDILLTTSGNCGNVAFVASEPQMPTLATNFVRVLRVDPTKTDAKFAFHYLRTRRFRNQIAPFVRGATIQNLSVDSAFGVVHMPSPPLEEQRRIAAILDGADALRAKRREVLAHLDDLTRSIFHDMFSREPWPEAKLGDLASTTSGGTPARGKTEYYGGEIPWVKSGELHSGLVVAAEESITELGLASSSARLLPPGTVLIAMYGATAGVVGQLGIEAATNQAVCAITPGPLLNDTYMIAMLRSLTETLLSRRAGGAQPNLSQGTIRSLEVSVPPMDLQREFAARIERCSAQHDTVKRSARADEDLFVSLQIHAFRGDL